MVRVWTILLVLLHLQSIYAQTSLALANTRTCESIKDDHDSRVNDADQCSALKFTDGSHSVHHCRCETDSDCRFGGEGSTAKFMENLVCCKSARPDDASNQFREGRCIDRTVEHCCQYDYGTGSNPDPGYVVVLLNTASAPSCCTWRNNANWIGTVNAPAVVTAFGACGCGADANCASGEECCDGTCVAEKTCCSTDSDCSGDRGVCCSNAAGVKRCTPKDECCIFHQQDGDNDANEVKRIFNPETQACCPFGWVSRTLTNSGTLQVTNPDMKLIASFVFTKAANPTSRCRCDPSGGTEAKNGRLSNGAAGSGCSDGETCCDLTDELLDTYWDITKSTDGVFYERTCDATKPNCLASCSGMCSSTCDASCVAALKYEGAGLVTTAKYSVAAPENLKCCKYEDGATRVIEVSDTDTATIRERRWHVGYYTNVWGKLDGTNFQRQICCPIGGVKTQNKCDKEFPLCDCFQDSDCTGPASDVGLENASDYKCCIEEGSITAGKCINSKTHNCCKKGTNKAFTEKISATSSTCGCRTDADCPAAVENGPTWSCCGADDEKDKDGVCFNSKIQQCCGGSTIGWDDYCCETVAQLREAPGSLTYPKSAADRRAAGSVCRCDDDADCANIKFEGAAAPGSWKCCAPGNSDCGNCYNDDEEQCCSAGPESLSGQWGVMGDNGKSLVASNGQVSAHMCCPLTGPVGTWTRNAQKDKTRTGGGHSNGDPANSCRCKEDSHCPEGYKCCHTSIDVEAHTCEADYLFGRTTIGGDSHCSGICINPEFQSCCGERGVNEMTVCFNKYEKCCGSGTNAPTCCNKFDSTCKQGTDDTYVFGEDVEKAFCTKVEHSTPTIVMVSIIFPILLAIVLLFAFVCVLIVCLKSEKHEDKAPKVLLLVCIILGAFITLFSVILCFTPLWKYSVICVAAVVTMLVSLTPDHGGSRLAAILAVVSVLFVVDPFVGNAAMSMHYYIGGELTEGALHSAQRLYDNSCHNYYDFYQKDTNFPVDYRETNGAVKYFGMCAPNWAHAVVVFTGMLVPFQILFVLIGLAANFVTAKSNRVAHS